MKALFSLQITIFLLIAVGFFLKRGGLIQDQGQKNLNDLVLNVILPCNILKAFLGGAGAEEFLAYGGVLLVSIGVQALCVVYGKAAFRREPEGRKKCLRYATICSNSGFLGNPVAEGLYGAQGLVLASIYLIPLRVMMWSNGLPIFSGIKDRRQLVKKVALHPCILSCAAGLACMFAGWRPPSGIMGVVDALGSCNTAMSMLVVGMILAQADLHDLWDKTVLKYSIHRLVVIPAIVFAVCYFLPIDKTSLGVCVILAAMPAGATTSILAEKYQMEPQFSTRLVVFSTLLSLPSIALWSLLLQAV